VKESPPNSSQLLSGWGRTPKSLSTALRFDDQARTTDSLEDEFLSFIVGDGPTLTPRGLGRSYGDAALNAGGLVTDPSSWRTTFDLDEVQGTLTVSSGYSLDEILREVVPKGYFVPVTPGTRYVTIGGAFAADIHGKNHHHSGSFGAHITAATILTPSGRHTTGPGDRLFDATLGGMGLTGMVSKLQMKLHPIETAYLTVTTKAPKNFAQTLQELETHDDDHRYSVAWIDCSIQGSKLGRSVITWGDHTTISDLKDARGADPLHYDPKVRIKAPHYAPSWLLNRLSVRAFNEAWYRKGLMDEGVSFQSIPSFFHPLDGVGDWNYLYGARGFLQYQVALPFGAEEVMEQLLHRLAHSGYPSFLAVLKRFGTSSTGLLSFPFPGWTLALDLPAHRPGLGHLLDLCDELILSAGGRTYLAKDSRVAPRHIPVMYPKLKQWQEIAEEYDPTGRFTSDLARRLRLRSLPKEGPLFEVLEPKTKEGPNR
jgi:decaprenylphospho-beta-D-ribofuranose 2-oxidase